MTKYIINSEKKIVTQKAEMIEPLSKYYTTRGQDNEVLDHDQDSYVAELKEYKKHLASLKSFPAEWVRPDQDGLEVVEGVDFKIVHGYFNDRSEPVLGWDFDTQIAIPLSPVAVAIPAEEKDGWPKSCEHSCSPSDWRKGGKCDLNGCYHADERKGEDEFKKMAMEGFKGMSADDILKLATEINNEKWEAVYKTEDWKKLKWSVGMIQFNHLSMNDSKTAIEANPATHAISQMIWNLLNHTESLPTHRSDGEAEMNIGDWINDLDLAFDGLANAIAVIKDFAIDPAKHSDPNGVKNCIAFVKETQQKIKEKHLKLLSIESQYQRQQGTEGWISVEERLPGSGEDVLCYNGFRMVDNCWEKYTDQDDRWFKRAFTHWMPLPHKPIINRDMDSQPTDTA